MICEPVQLNHLTEPIRSLKQAILADEIFQIRAELDKYLFTTVTLFTSMIFFIKMLIKLQTFESFLLFVERHACRGSPDIRFDVFTVQSDGQITVGLGHGEPAAHKHSRQA